MTKLARAAFALLICMSSASAERKMTVEELLRPHVVPSRPSEGVPTAPPATPATPLVAPTPVQAVQEPDRYCRYGIKLVGNTSGFVDASSVYQNCRPGDSILIPNGHAHLIAETCDFSKSVVPVSTYTACIVGQPRQAR
jgi:hypothetical protein